LQIEVHDTSIDTLTREPVRPDTLPSSVASVAGNGSAVSATPSKSSVQNGLKTASYRPPIEAMASWERSAIGWAIVLFAALLLSQLFAIWPAVMAATTVGGHAPVTTFLFGAKHVVLNSEVALLLMVCIMGALASLVELIRAFTKHAGQGNLTHRWAWWYGLRPIQGAALALVVYFALRGGLLGIDSTKPLNPYGLAAFAGFVGLFTRHAVSKLSQVFDTLFGQPAEDANIEPIDSSTTAQSETKPVKAATGSK
jgi:hypothetical protein